MKKIRVAVLYGGRSGEHEVSLASAFSVVKNLDPNRFDIVPIGVDKQGKWWLNDLKQLPLDSKTKTLPLHTESHLPLQTAGNLASQHANNIQNNENFFDVVFPVMHGTYCEDGTLQGLLESVDIPYVGAAVLGSALAMDKDIAKRLVAANGIPVAPYISIKQEAWKKDSAFFEKLIAQQFHYPVFVKPANLGSSVGIHKVKSAEDLVAAVEDAFLYDLKILVEKAVNAREIELAVLENSDDYTTPLVSIPGEIVPKLSFYSYEAKYLDENGAQLLIPAPLEIEQTKKAQQLARKIFEILECESMARVDLFLDKDSGEFYFNEINTLPGFTQISMYPKLWEASGISYSDLLSRLIDLALARHEKKSNLKREWASEDRK